MKIIVNKGYIETDKPFDFLQFDPKVVMDTDFPLHVCFNIYTKTGIKPKVFKKSVYKIFQAEDGLIRKMKLPMGTYYKNKIWSVDSSIRFHTKRDFDCFCIENNIPIQNNKFPLNYFEDVQKKDYYDPKDIILPKFDDFIHKAKKFVSGLSYKEFYASKKLKIFNSNHQLPKSKFAVDEVKDDIFYTFKYTDTKLYQSMIKNYLSDMVIIKDLIPSAKGIIISNVEYKGILPDYIIVKVLDE